MINTNKLKQTLKPLLVIAGLAFLMGLNTASAYSRYGSKKENPVQTDTVTNDTTIYTNPYGYPVYPGGGAALVTFLESKMKYPRQMMERQLGGKVMVQFIVEKDGSLTNIKALKGLGFGSSEEAICLVKLLPKWKPGYNKDGQPVRVQQQVPVVFLFKKTDQRSGFQIINH